MSDSPSPVPIRDGTGLRLIVDNTVYEIKSKHPLGEETPDSEHCTDITLQPAPNGGIEGRDAPEAELQFVSEGHRQAIATVSSEPKRERHHPCEELDYENLYRTLLRAATELAENEAYERSDELVATALGLRSELARCDGHARTEHSGGRR